MIKLTNKYTNKPVWVNVSAILYIEEDTSFPVNIFIRMSNKESLFVTESLAEVLSKLPDYNLS